MKLQILKLRPFNKAFKLWPMWMDLKRDQTMGSIALIVLRYETQCVPTSEWNVNSFSSFQYLFMPVSNSIKVYTTIWPSSTSRSICINSFQCYSWLTENIHRITHMLPNLGNSWFCPIWLRQGKVSAARMQEVTQCNSNPWYCSPSGENSSY